MGSKHRTPEEKWQIVQQVIKSGNVSETCRRHGVAPNLLYRWKGKAAQGAKAALGGRSATAAKTEQSERTVGAEVAGDRNPEKCSGGVSCVEVHTRSDEYRRYRAVELMEQGESKALISRILGVFRASLNTWQRRSRRGEDLKSKPLSGRPRSITDEQLAELSRLLSEGAVAHGWENNLWTSLRVREVIKKHFGIKFTRWHV